MVGVGVSPSPWHSRNAGGMGRLGSAAEEWAGSAGPGFGFSSLPSVCASASPHTVSIFPLLSCPSCHGKAEECISLCRALLSALTWFLRCATFYAEKVKDPLEQAAAENQLKMCLERLEKVLSSTKNRALIHIAKLEETCTSLPRMLAWRDVIATSPFPLPSSCRIVPAAPSLSIFQPCCCNCLLSGSVPLSAPSPPCCPWKRSRINVKAA